MEEYKASGSEEAVNVDVKLNNGVSENNKKKEQEPMTEKIHPPNVEIPFVLLCLTA